MNIEAMYIEWFIESYWHDRFEFNKLVLHWVIVSTSWWVRDHDSESLGVIIRQQIDSFDSCCVTICQVLSEDVILATEAFWGKGEPSGQQLAMEQFCDLGCGFTTCASLKMGTPRHEKSLTWAILNWHSLTTANHGSVTILDSGQTPSLSSQAEFATTLGTEHLPKGWTAEAAQQCPD